MVKVWDARKAVYDGLGALEWHRYLRAMWIISGQLQDLYSQRLSRYDRSLEGETLDLVRRVALMGESPDADVIAAGLHGRWKELLSSHGEYMGAGERNTWLVLRSLAGEISDSRRHYGAREWVNTAATRIWMEQERPLGLPMWINNPNQEAGADDPIMLTLSRLKHIIDEVAMADELDPAELKQRILLSAVIR
jgi:hypothetical protein